MLTKVGWLLSKIKSICTSAILCHICARVWFGFGGLNKTAVGTKTGKKGKSIKALAAKTGNRHFQTGYLSGTRLRHAYRVRQHGNSGKVENSKKKQLWGILTQLLTHG